MYFCLNRSTTVLYASLFMALSFLILMKSGAASAADRGYQDAYSAESKSDSNKAKIEFIQSEIDRISQDFDWLSSRVKKMEQFKRFIPDRMYQSLAFKRNKIKILKKLIEQLEVVSKKDKKIKPVKKASSAPQKAVGSPSGEKRIVERIKKYGLVDWLELIKDKGGARIENRLPILFASGSAEIADEYKTFLKNVAMVLKESKVSILVDGYADTDPIHTAKYPSNSELSTARASSVSRELIKNGISPDVFKTGVTRRQGSAEHKASKWKALDRHVNLTILLQP